MLVTVFGMAISAKELQPKKASLPMLVTVFGIEIFAKEVQS